MPLRNLFRRQDAEPTLRERAADIRANLADVRQQLEPLPAPGSEEAMAAFHVACREHSLRTQFANGYPDLKRTPLEWWTTDTLGAAMETGEITPTECARLYPLATERELRMRVVEHELKLGALHALAFADSYPVKEQEVIAAPDAIDFGPDAHIAELATEFCRAFTNSAVIGRAFIANTVSEEEWQPHHDATVALMNKLEATKPKTLLGMALKCLGPIGAAAWDVPTDGDKGRLDRWERLGEQFENALMVDTLAPVAISGPDLVGLVNFEAATMRELHAIHDMTNEVSTVAHAMVSSGRGMAEGGRGGSHEPLTPAGSLMLWVAEALNAVEDAAYNEIKRRKPEDLYDQEIRLRVLAPMVIANGDKIETAGFARELLAFAEH